MAGFLAPSQAALPADLMARAAKGKPVRAAIARAGAPLPMSAAQKGAQAGLIEPILIGESDAIKQQANVLDWDISDIEIHDTMGETDAAMKAAQLCGAGDADVLMKGQLHTDVFMKSALSRDNGLRLGDPFIHIFAHFKDDAVLLLSDAAVNVAPDLTVRQGATRLMVKLLQLLGQAPKIAFLSATETVIPSVPSSGEASELAQWAKDTIPNADFSGPLALDLALSKESRDIKGIKDDPVAGCANGIIVPDIVAGNALYKSLCYVGGALAGGIVLGGKVPILLTSRADSAQARLASIALAAIWAHNKA